MIEGPALFLVFAAVTVVAVWAVNRLILRVRLVRRLNLVRGGTGRMVLETKLLGQSANIRGSFGRGLAILGGLLPLGEDDRMKITVALGRAGYRSANATAVVIGAKAVCVLGGLVAGLVALPPLVPGVLGWGVGAIGGLLLGVMLNLVPELAVARMAASRYRKIQVGLADALDLLIVCLESGATFERALQRTLADLRMFRPELAAELRQASLDMSVHGRTRGDALERLAARLGSRDLRDLATTVDQSERHGTPLADALRKLGGSLRVQQIAAMQGKMARLPVLLVLPTVAGVLPGIMVIVAGPAFVKLTESLGELTG
ncbi:MAG: type II secretion system F family protein [Gammaproteobacteria bacterium]|nr:type II secretion system F family protein [Gammaproteobacteria bacterium]